MTEAVRFAVNPADPTQMIVFYNSGRLVSLGGAPLPAQAWRLVLNPGLLPATSPSAGEEQTGR